MVNIQNKVNEEKKSLCGSTRNSASYFRAISPRCVRAEIAGSILGKMVFIKLLKINNKAFPLLQRKA